VLPVPGGPSGAQTTSCFALNPIAIALEGEAIYEIELKLPTVTPASMSIGVAL
jgi:23S rRNA maturation mini-RNase III